MPEDCKVEASLLFKVEINLIILLLQKYKTVYCKWAMIKPACAG